MFSTRTLLAVALTAATLAATAAPADAQVRRNNNGRIAAGIAGGILAGALIAGAVSQANARPTYARPAPVYHAPAFEDEGFCRERLVGYARNGAPIYQEYCR